MSEEAGDGYYIDKAYEDVRAYLGEVKRRVKLGLFKVSEREDKNLPFMRRYNLVDKKRQADMLLGLCPEDFVHAVQSKLEGNEGQELYVFIKKYPLYEMLNGIVEKWVYTKIDLVIGQEQVALIVSFHEAERIPDSFPFG